MLMLAAGIFAMIGFSTILTTITWYAVKELQSIFGLPQTGEVDFATLYKISQIYVGISRIAELN